MKVFSRFMEKELITPFLEEVKDIDFNLFVDNQIESLDQLSPINIWYHQEPNMYFGNHDLIIQNQQYFNVVLFLNNLQILFDLVVWVLFVLVSFL